MNKRIIEEDMEDIYTRDIPWKELDGKTVLVTGANGMLASYIIFMLIFLNRCKNMNIHIVANVRSKEKFERRFGAIEQYPFIELYMKDINQEIEIDQEIDFIIHAASLASPQYYAVTPVEVMEPNVIANYYLLRLAQRKCVESYLLFSTGDIYGKHKDVRSIKENDYGIMDPLDVHSCYGESKRMAETMCKCWQHQHGIPTKIARIWHTYAPTMDIENDPRVFASFVNDIVHNRSIIMKSDGMAKRSFCYITDAVFGFFKILLRGKDGEAYNVCNTEEFYSILELAEKLVRLYPEKGLRVIKKMRDSDDPYLENASANFASPDNTKLIQLGWEAKCPVEIGFKRVVDYFM